MIPWSSIEFSICLPVSLTSVKVKGPEHVDYKSLLLPSLVCGLPLPPPPPLQQQQQQQQQ